MKVMMMMMVIVLYQEGDDCHSGIHQKEFREMEFILSCLGEWARNFSREHDLRKNWKLPFFICVVSNFQPKMVFFMKSFIASLFYVFLASISLFFSFLIFSNSFSFRFRNNTACTHNTRFLCSKIYSSRTSVSYVPFLMLWEGEGARRYFIMREGNFWNVHGWWTGLACQYDNKNNVFVCSLIVNLIYTVFMVKFKTKFHKCTFTNMREIWKYVKS